MEAHQDALLKRCRVGGKKFSSISKPSTYPACEFVRELKVCFGVDVELDEPGVHPPLICVVCHRVASHCRDAEQSGREFVGRGGGCGEPWQWSPDTSLL